MKHFLNYKPFKREIICSYKLFEKMKNSYPKRTVIPDSNCGHDVFYYFGIMGNVRLVYTIDWSIWVCDHEKGFPFMKQLR